VTPISDDSINVNFVWHKKELETPTIETLTERFPLLRSRLGAAPPISEIRGAGPMGSASMRRSADRLVLIGDAAGFVDSISADGLSIAFNSGLLLGRALPRAIARGASESTFREYEHGERRLFRSYWAVTNGLLWIVEHPRVRRTLIHVLGRHPLLSRNHDGRRDASDARCRARVTASAPRGPRCAASRATKWNRSAARVRRAGQSSPRRRPRKDEARRLFHSSSSRPPCESGHPPSALRSPGTSIGSR